MGCKYKQGSGRRQCYQNKRPELAPGKSNSLITSVLCPAHPPCSLSFSPSAVHFPPFAVHPPALKPSSPPSSSPPALPLSSPALHLSLMVMWVSLWFSLQLQLQPCPPPLPPDPFPSEWPLKARACRQSCVGCNRTVCGILNNVPTGKIGCGGGNYTQAGSAGGEAVQTDRPPCMSGEPGRRPGTEGPSGDRFNKD